MGYDGIIDPYRDQICPHLPKKIAPIDQENRPQTSSTHLHSSIFAIFCPFFWKTRPKKTPPKSYLGDGLLLLHFFFPSELSWGLKYQNPPDRYIAPSAWPTAAIFAPLFGAKMTQIGRQVPKFCPS